MSELAVLTIKVDSSGAIRSVESFADATGRATKTTSALSGSVAGFARSLLPLVGGAALLNKFITETSQAQAVQAQLAAALRSTGGAAGQTIQSLNAHAAALQRMTTFSDEAVGQAQALLLTFTKIQGETFPAATQAVLDVAQALGGDLRGAAIQVGKALNDPVLGVTALARAGIQFTESQKETIKSLVETGRQADAQRLILKELETQMGGSAVAAANTLGGALKQLGNAFGELFEKDRNSSGMGFFIDGIQAITEATRDLGLTWRIIFAQMEVAALKLTEVLDRRVLNGVRGVVGAGLFKATNGAFGGGMLADAGAENAAINELVATLDRYIEEMQKDLVRRRSGGGAGAGSGAGAGGGILAIATAEELAAVEAVIRQHYADSATLLANRFENEEAFQKALAAMTEQHHRDSAEAFAYRIEMELGGLKKLATAVQNLRSKITDGVERKVSGAFGGGLIGGAIGGFAGAMAGKAVDKMFNDAVNGLHKMFGGGTSKWEQVAAAQHKAAEAQLKAAGAMAQSFQQGRAGWMNDFLNYANNESAQQRETRGLTNQRNALAMSSFDLAKSAGAGVSNFLQNLVNAGNWGGAAEAARIEAMRDNQTALGRQSLLAFADSLDQLEKALGANIAQVNKLALAERNQALARQMSSLAGFRDSLMLSGQSPLSPMAQLQESRRQYEMLVALGKGGDASAIDSLPAAARAFLDASRAVNASGARYAQDFTKVTEDTNALMAALQAQVVDEAVQLDEIIDVEWKSFAVQEAILHIQEAQVTVAQEASAVMSAKLDAVVTAVETMQSVIKNAIEATE